MKKFVVTGLAAATLAMAISAGVFVGQATADQPHMRAALDALITARDQLAVAEHNKGGHRAEALRLTRAAIEETRAGIAAGE